jgi:AraC-like DNA-binding protein/mannose-6-phosphate isomerase-like protein (cupin superfamily)
MKQSLRNTDHKPHNRLSHPLAGEVGGDEFPWVSSRTLRFTAQGEFPLAFPPECPVRLHFLRFTADHPVTPNYHEFLELTLICAGRGRFTVDHRCYPVAAGDLVLVGSHAFHLLEAERGQPVKAASVHFRPELVHGPGSPALDLEYLKPFHYRCANFSHRIDRAALPERLVLDRLGRMRREIEAGGEGYPLAVKTYLTDLLLEVSRHYRQVGGGWFPQDRRIRDFERLRAVFDFLRKNCREPISLSQMARRAHLSPHYFCRFFKAVTGHTLTEYVWRLRVDLAADFLLHSAMPITEIAYAAGFSSHSHLDRVFKRLKGVTPLEYRRQRNA